MAAADQTVDLPATRVYVARQPIFARDSTIFGYELLYRSGLANRFDLTDTDGELASVSVLSSSAFVFGVEALAGGSKAFVNFTRAALLNDYARLFAAERLVVEVLEGVDADAEVRAACLRLKRDGYQIALDDWDPDGSTGGLVDLADIVKIDFLAFDMDRRRELARQLASRGVTLIAEKVETAADAAQAWEFGYAYAQGYFYARPEIKVGTRASGFRPHRLQLLRALNSADPDLGEVEGLLRRDPGLAYQLMTYLNSAAIGLRSRVTGIRQAILLLGQAGVRTWATVAILADAGSDRPHELIVTSVVRGRFCELAGLAAGLPVRPHDLSLLGLFSLIDAIVGQPLHYLLTAICLPRHVIDGILGEPGELADLLNLVRAYERAEWATVEALTEQLGLPRSAIPQIYVDAVAWGNRAHLLK